MANVVYTSGLSYVNVELIPFVYVEQDHISMAVILIVYKQMSIILYFTNYNLT